MPELPQQKSEATAPGSGTEKAGRSGVLHFSTVELLIALILLFISAPLLEQFQNGELIESGLMTLVLVAAVLAVGARRRTLVFAILLAVPAVVTKWANHLWPDLVSLELYFSMALIFLLFVVINLLRFILRAPRVNLDVLCGGIAGYLLLGLLWTLAYLIVAQRVPNSFAYNVGTTTSSTLDPFSALYFSFVTLTTTGYGDFIPVSRMARMLAVMEAMTGTFYVAVLISRLVAMYSSQPPTPKAIP